MEIFSPIHWLVLGLVGVALLALGRLVRVLDDPGDDRLNR